MIVLPVKVYLEDLSISSEQLCVSTAPNAMESSKKILLNLDKVRISLSLFFLALLYFEQTKVRKNPFTSKHMCIIDII